MIVEFIQIWLEKYKIYDRIWIIGVVWISYRNLDYSARDIQI